VIDALSQFPEGHRTAIYSAAGDRRDVDMVRQGEILADHFDRIILYEDQYTRGRQPGEIAAMFKQGIDRGRRCKEVYDVVGWEKAVDQALKLLKKDDLMLLQADTIDATVQYLQRAIEHENLGREIDLDVALRTKQEPEPSAAVDPTASNSSASNSPASNSTVGAKKVSSDR
jgi:cyanophycin synthetase